MSSSSSLDVSQKSVTIKKDDDTFFSRLVSKENSVANPSFRVYYGNVSSSVPFTWEIQPGTPKHNGFHNASIPPPLTPPPSYYTSNPGNKKPTKSKYYHKSKQLYNLLFNNNHFIRKGYVPTSSPSSLSASSWSSSMASTVPSSKGYTSRRRHHFSSFGSSFDDGHMYGVESPDSVMCFGINNNKIRNRKGAATAYKLVMMKKAFFAILSRKSG